MEQLYRYDQDYLLKGKTGEEGFFSQELANRPCNYFYIGQNRKSLRAKYTCKTSCPSYIREKKEITHNKGFKKKIN